MRSQLALSKNALVQEHPRLPCVKGAGMAVSRKAMTEGLSEWASSDPLSPSVRTGAAPLGQQGEPLRFAISPWKNRGIVTGGNPWKGSHQSHGFISVRKRGRPMAAPTSSMDIGQLFRDKSPHPPRTRFRASTSLSSSMGLDRWQFIPASRDFFTSSAKALADMARMGRVRRSGRSGVARI